MAQQHVIVQFDGSKDSYSFIASKPGRLGAKDVDQLLMQMLRSTPRGMIIEHLLGEKPGIKIVCGSAAGLAQIKIVHEIRKSIKKAGWLSHDLHA